MSSRAESGGLRLGSLGTGTDWVTGQPDWHEVMSTLALLVGVVTLVVWAAVTH